MTSASDSSSSRQSSSSTSLGHLGVDLEPHDAAELAAPAQHRLDRLEEVLGFVLELEVGVAGDAERVVREHLHPGEQRVELRRDHLLERHEALAVGERRRSAGSSGGTFTRAKRSSPLDGSRTVTARLSDRFEM